jgi:hypothetical protein
MLTQLRATSAFVCLGLAATLAPPVFSQVSLGTGAIEGFIQDASGAAVPGAQVEVRNVGTGLTRAGSTDMTGRYTMLSLPVGEYEIKATANGFRTTVRSGITLVIGRTAVADIELAVGQVTDTVSVTAAPSLVETTHATLGEVVQNKQIVELPLNGRSYAQLALLSAQVVGMGGPGIGTRTQENAIGTSGFFSISGSRPEGNQFTFNGINVTNEFTGGTFAYPPIDSVQEFKILQNSYSAELGGRAGQVVLTSKAGGNQFHGSVYEFLRNDHLDANNFFLNLAGQKKRPLKLNQFGASLGGPILIPRVYNGKNRTFFFFNYEGARIRRGAPATTTVPTALMRTGDFTQLGRAITDPTTRNPFPDAIIPASRLNQIALNTIRLAQYPVPNITGINNNYVLALSNAQTLNQVSTRFDHSFSESDKIWGSFFWTPLNNASPRFTYLSDGRNAITTQAYSSNWTHVFSPNLLNEFKAGFNFASHQDQNRSPQGLTNADLGFPNNANQPQAKGVSAGIPSFNASGYGVIGAATSSPRLFKTRHYQIADTLNWIRGAHAFRFGVDITREHEDQRFNPQIRGNYSFGGAYTGNGFADYLLGLPSSAIREILLPAYDIFESLHRGTHYYFFAQDDWKVSRNLTFNLGFRYEFNSPVVEARDRQANYYPKVVNGVGRILRIDAPDPEFGRCLCIPAKKDFGPRFGFAYRPGNSERTVIRSGYGIFYAYVPYNTKQTQAFNAPWIDRQTVTNTVPTPTFDLSNSFIPASLASAFSGFSNDLNFLDGMIQQWNFNIQREVVRSVMVELAYAGSLAVHLDNNASLNAANPGPGAAPPRRPFPNERVVVSANNGSTSTYHAFTAKARKEFSQGLTFLTHYTQSKALDNSSSQLSDFQNPNNIRSNKAVSGFHVARRFVGSTVYELPFGKGKKFLNSMSRPGDLAVGGWAITGIYTLQSGFFFSPSAANTIGIENGGVRPDRLRDGNLTVGERTRLRWFDTGAFAAVPTGQYRFGTAGRNILEGPGLKNFDLGILKNIRLHELRQLQFRAEFFNTFNNVNFGLPNGNITSTAIGTIGSTIGGSGANREIQFGLKYLF